MYIYIYINDPPDNILNKNEKAQKAHKRILIVYTSKLKRHAKNRTEIHTRIKIQNDRN